MGEPKVEQSRATFAGDAFGRRARLDVLVALQERHTFSIESGIGGATSAFPVASEEDSPASAALPVALGLPAYPNPVRGTATVAVPAAQRVSVAVDDLLGRRVAVRHEGALPAGTHALPWEAGALPGGVYLVRVVGETAVQTQRVTVVQ